MRYRKDRGKKIERRGICVWWVCEAYL
ncbi:hypothetical protein [Paenibacillus sp. Leaf72]|nr:hypothetical protein [Paenibacillus sp. Leaf72]